MADNNQNENLAPLEESFKKILDPVEEVVHDETSGGLLLMASAGLAGALLVNSMPDNDQE